MKRPEENTGTSGGECNARICNNCALSADSLNTHMYAAAPIIYEIKILKTFMLSNICVFRHHFLSHVFTGCVFNRWNLRKNDPKMNAGTFCVCF